VQLTLQVPRVTGKKNKYTLCSRLWWLGQKQKTFNHYNNFCLMAMCQLLAVYLNNTSGGKFFLIFQVGFDIQVTVQSDKFL